MTRKSLAATSYLGVAVLLTGCGGSGDTAASSPAVVRAPEAGETFFGALQQITFGGQNAEAYFSPDGQRLIFQYQSSDTTCDQQYVVNVDGSNLRRVSNGLGRTTCGYFYHGGSRVLYSSTHHVDERCPAPPSMTQGYVWKLFDFDIYAARDDGSDLGRLLGGPSYDAEATLSPDGQTIVFTSTRDGDLDIYTMGIDGTGLRRLTTTIGYDGGAFFSHDGTKIVYRAWHPTAPQDIADYQSLLRENLVRPSRMEVFVMNADGSDQRRITDLGGANFAPFFTPDDQRIIFSSNHHEGPRSRNFDLFLINLDGSGLTQVTNTPTFDGFPMFSPDGTKLVFASNRYGEIEGETNLFIADWVERRN